MFGNRLRFPIYMFVDILIDILFSNLKMCQIQNKYLELYKETQNRVKPYKKSNNMDISAFKKYLRLKSIDKIKKNRPIFEKLEFDQKNVFIYNYINWIIINYYYDHKDIVENWSKLYRKNIEWRDADKPTINKIDSYEKEAFIQNTISKSKIKKVDFAEIRKDIRVRNFSKNQDKLNKIGQIGEEIIFNILKKEFGKKMSLD